MHTTQPRHTPLEAPVRVSPIPTTDAAQHARRIVWRRLMEARDLKTRIDTGQAFPWEVHRLTSVVLEARRYARLARTR
jgi:hypothetical protein